MEELSQKQQAIGQEIQRVITNYKKDSVSQKTNQEYFEEQLRKLEGLWDEFEINDNQIRCLPQPPLEHEYFKCEYYSSMQKVYHQYKQHFLENMARFDQASGCSGNGAKPKNTEPQNLPVHTHGKDDSTLNNQPPEMTRSRSIRRQRVIMESLSRLLGTIEIDGQPRSYYDLKMNTINRYWTQIEQLHYNILESEDNTMEYNTDAYIQLESAVQIQLTNLTKKLDNQSEPVRHAPTSTSPMLKLPKITLPKFDGEYLKWRQFHDLFSEMVHKQPMADCQKMWYLKTNLLGEAERLIRHLTLSDENYSAAWKILQDRYNNPRLLVAAFVNRLMSQPSHASESTSANAIKSLHDTTQECLRGLENLGISVDNWDPLLLHILLKKVDKTTHTLYEQSLADPKKLQTIKDFLSFLENRFQSLEALGSKGKMLDEVQKRHSTSNSFTSIAARTLKCVTCKGNHKLFACKQFLELSPISTKKKTQTLPQLHEKRPQ